MKPEQNEAAQECSRKAEAILSELMAFGDFVQEAGANMTPSSVPAVWLDAIGSITRRLAAEAAGHLGNLP